jgi:translation elongation factor EF-Tu-like GTPase
MIGKLLIISTTSTYNNTKKHTRRSKEIDFYIIIFLKKRFQVEEHGEAEEEEVEVKLRKPRH